MASSLCLSDLIARSHCCGRQQRMGQLWRPCTCVAAAREQEYLERHRPSAEAHRRELLASVSLLIASCSAPRWCEAQAQAIAEPEASTSGQDNIYETTDFYMKIPARYQQAFDAPVPPERLGRGQAQPQTPLKARFLSDVKGAQITIVARESFQIKPTFFQCQDISQLGSVTQLSSVLLPPGAKLLSASSQEVTEPDRDMSAYGGFVLQPRQTIYRYEFETDAGLRVTMAAAARVGKVFFAGGIAPIKGWSSAAPELQEAVSSFRLLQTVRNV